MHRLPLQLLLFAGALIGSLAVAQPYIVSDAPSRFDDPIVARPAAEADAPPAPEVVEADKVPVTPAPAPAPPPVVAEAEPERPVAPPVVKGEPACEVPRSLAGARPAPHGDAAALAAREILSWGVMDDLLAARGHRGLPVPLGEAPLKDRAFPALPCAAPLR
ncbi:hypothetical protein [Histidinibacterium lentulum]|uniref:Uncharacterized protein n=1 Tax=Histidinibacterium lentulum TaxID=2480588 RepID=A0A3N2QTQ4_9RHOB|nr:hypothetical protein [Histidinibacterium lentulum]ROT98550.1 hypothetical protein EAT49_16555 [Histidinibacterium lentulum]